MFVLFHLIFEVIRISILAVVYGFLLRFLIAKVRRGTLVKKRILFPVLFVALFIWRFSYWRNNGLGDYGRVPLNSQYYITMIDFNYANVEKRNENDDGFGLTSMIQTLYEERDILYTKTTNGFAILNLESGDLHSQLSEQEFLNNNGDTTKLIEPSQFHSNYWGWGLLFY